MKKVIFISCISILLSACSINQTYPGKNISVEGMGYKFSCGKTQSQTSISFDPSKLPAGTLSDDSNTIPTKNFMNLLDEAIEKCNTFLNDDSKTQ